MSYKLTSQHTKVSPRLTDRTLACLSARQLFTHITALPGRQKDYLTIFNIDYFPQHLAMLGGAVVRQDILPLTTLFSCLDKRPLLTLNPPLSNLHKLVKSCEELF